MSVCGVPVVCDGDNHCRCWWCSPDERSARCCGCGSTEPLSVWRARADRGQVSERAFRWLFVGVLVVGLLVVASRCGVGCAEKSCEPSPEVTVP